MPEAGLYYCHVGRIDRRLRQIAHTEPIMENHLPLIRRIRSRQDIQKRGFSRAILGNQAYFLSLANAKGEVLKQGAVTHPSC